SRGLPRTESATATTVSAPIASARKDGAGSARTLARARRSARTPGASPGSGVSSTSDGRIVNSSPAPRRRSALRGEAETRTIVRDGIVPVVSEAAEKNDQRRERREGAEHRQTQNDPQRQAHYPELKLQGGSRPGGDTRRQEPSGCRVGQRLAQKVRHGR